MNVLLDTHTIFWLFTNDKKLTIKAKDKFRKATKVFIPTIVLTELLYLLIKKGLDKEYLIIIRQLENEGRINFISLDLETAKIMGQLVLPLEMHDGIIVASAKVLNIPIVTKDEAIRNIYPKTIW